MNISFFKNILTKCTCKKAFWATLFFLTISVSPAFAVGPFTPGETLDPGCAPGAANCTVLGLTAATTTGNFGIATSSPYAKLSVVGEIVGAYFTGTTTATSTFGGPIVTTGTATSTFVNGLNIAGGCFAVNGTCIGGSATDIQFSTTSADYWKTQTNFYSTTSANYWLTQQTTSGLTEGSNLYFTTARATTSFIANLAATTSVASITTLENLVTTGALNSGSITSGFGSIDIGADALTAGAGSLSSLTVSGLTTLARASSTLASVLNGLYIGTTATTTLLGNGATSTISGPISVGATTAGTSTFNGGIQTTYLNVTGASATSTFAKGIDIAAGCYAVNGTCLSSGAGTVNSGTSGQFAYYSGSGTAVSGTSVLSISSGTITANNSGGATTLVVRAGSGQSSSNLFEIQNSSSVALLSVTADGKLRATSSVITSPSVSFQNDSSAGIGSYGSGVLAFFQQSGTPGAVLTATGLGIGTTSPYARLSVAGDVVASSYAATSTTATTTISNALYVASTTPTQNFSFAVGTSTPSLVVSRTNGNVGIGSSTPSARLSIASLGSGTTTSVFQITSSASTPQFTVFDNGNIGIGTTTNPYGRIQVTASAAYGSGGTVSDVSVGGVLYRVHTFTSSGTFVAPTGATSISVDYLVVGGGGGGGASSGDSRAGGGGGAGGYLSGSASLTGSGSYAITVGSGGGSATNGGNSTFNGVTGTGGGAGGSGGSSAGQTGGSGGGGAGAGGGTNNVGGSGTGGQGNSGGNGGFSAVGAGGGGGSSAGGSSTNAAQGAAGGAGTANSITGTSVTYAAGGGGGGNGVGGSGGSSCAGAGSGSTTGASATGNGCGGGGGGGGSASGGSGSAGIVIIRYATTGGYTPTGASAIFEGMVGIGTTTPISTLSVQGSLCVRDTGSCGTTAGTIYATNATLSDIDLAENYPTNDMTLAPGEIVSLDTDNSEKIKRASRGDKAIVGIVSTNPGLTLGLGIVGKPVALAGRVPVNVNLEGGDIAIGDKIAVSSVPGVGMKSAGTSDETIGIALESFTASSTKNQIVVFVEHESARSATDITITPEGNVGIGTTTPEYKLHVMGDIAATSFINISTRDAKTDITYLDDIQTDDVLAKIKKMKIASYHYLSEDAENPLRMGLIAEEAPLEILSVGGKGVDVYKLGTFILAGMQAQERKIETLEAFFGSTTLSIATSTASSLPQTFRGFFGDYMTSLGASIVNGAAYFKSLFVTSLQVGTTEVPAGITLFDEVTKEPYCVKISNGALVQTKGACGVIVPPPTQTQGDNNPGTSPNPVVNTGNSAPENQNLSGEASTTHPQIENGTTTAPAETTPPQITPSTEHSGSTGENPTEQTPPTTPVSEVIPAPTPEPSPAPSEPVPAPAPESTPPAPTPEPSAPAPESTN